MILFLDIDDVLTTNWSFKQSRGKKNWYNEKTYPFDPRCVAVLNEVLTLVPMKIVLTSDWRAFYTLPEIQKIFLWNKVNQIPVDYTHLLPDNEGELFNDRIEKRDIEITKYINDNNITDFIIFDDMPLKCYPERFLKCKIDEGLKQSGTLNRVIKLLKSLKYLEQ